MEIHKMKLHILYARDGAFIIIFSNYDIKAIHNFCEEVKMAFYYIKT